MTTTTHIPADTRTMAIVHDALRRDLARATAALSTAPCPTGAQRAAIGAHISWMMAFLHAHHEGEDAGLWPRVRELDPRAGQILDTLADDHHRIAPLIDECDRAARDYAATTDDEARVALLAAIARLEDVLLPHLHREENDVMPLVSVVMGDAELRAIDDEYFVKPKSVSQLAVEGHWLLDGLDAERTRVVLRKVSAMKRFVLVHGFRRRYQRQAAACWGPVTTDRRPYGPAPDLPRRIPRTGEVETVVAAPIDAVWRVVTDVTRVGEWSHECRRVEWIDGATRAVPGARFRGSNKAGVFRWNRVNEVLVADAPHTFAWQTVSTLRFPDSTRWQFRLEAVDGGTRITQSYELVRSPAVLAWIYSMMIPAHRERSSGLTDDLRRIGEVAEHDAVPESPPAAWAIGA
jgi:hypothetical protein